MCFSLMLFPQWWIIVTLCAGSLWSFPQRTTGLLLLMGFHCKDTCPCSPVVFIETSTVCWLHPDFQIPRSSFLWYICNVLKRKQCFVTGTICRTPDILSGISGYRVFPYTYTSLPLHFPSASFDAFFCSTMWKIPTNRQLLKMLACRHMEETGSTWGGFLPNFLPIKSFIPQ